MAGGRGRRGFLPGWADGCGWGTSISYVSASGGRLGGRYRQEREEESESRGERGLPPAMGGGGEEGSRSAAGRGAGGRPAPRGRFAPAPSAFSPAPLRPPRAGPGRALVLRAELPLPSLPPGVERLLGGREAGRSVGRSGAVRAGAGRGRSRDGRGRQRPRGSVSGGAAAAGEIPLPAAAPPRGGASSPLLGRAGVSERGRLLPRSLPSSLLSPAVLALAAACGAAPHRSVSNLPRGAAAAGTARGLRPSASPPRRRAARLGGPAGAGGAAAAVCCAVGSPAS